MNGNARCSTNATFPTIGDRVEPALTALAKLRGAMIGRYELFDLDEGLGKPAAWDAQKADLVEVRFFPQAMNARQ